MPQPRRTRFIVLALGGGGLALAGFFWGRHQGRAHALPPLVEDPRLPALFNQTLQSKYAAAKSQPKDPEPLRSLARLYEANRHYAEARVCYARVARLSGGLTAHDHYDLAEIAENENDLARVQTELAFVKAEAPDYLPARLLLGDADLKTGREAEAVKEYSAVRAIEPNQPEASLSLARLDLQQGNEAAAVDVLAALLSAHPQCAAAAALYAPILERRGESEKAGAMVAISQQKPEPPIADPWRSALLVDCYDAQRLSLAFEDDFKNGRMDEATPLLDRLSSLDPKNPIAMMFAGFSHAKALEHITAIREYYTALEQGGSPEKIVPLLVQSLLALGKVSEADSLMAELYAKMPESMPLTKAYATVALREGNDSLARPLLSKVLQKEPFLKEQNMELARILWSAGEYDAAALCLQRVAFVYASDVPSRALLGEYFLRKSQPMIAIKPLEEAVKFVAPKTAEQQNIISMLVPAYLQAADKNGGDGKLELARDEYYHAAQLAPENLAALAGEANVCTQLKDYDGAAKALGKIASLDPNNPTVYLSWGDVLYQSGSLSEAQLRWQKADSLSASGDAALKEAIAVRLSGHVTAEMFR